MEKKWKIWIDTGGTFTDCMAIDPEGGLHRVKVLSKSALRGKIVGILDPTSLVFSSSWATDSDIFRNYHFRILGEDQSVTKIRSLESAEKIIHLDREILSDDFKGHDFEIFANEEAPLLATRIVTKTSLFKSFPLLEMRLGSTIGTNALLERKGAKTALIVTRGFKDLLVIGNQQRPDIFSLHIEKPPPLYAEVFELDERLSRDGTPLVIPDERSFQYINKNLVKRGIESIAISLLHSYQNQDHEKKLKLFFELKNQRYITSSSEIAPVIHYLNRTETCVVNAYLAPLVKRYLDSVIHNLEQGSLRIMTSAGGLVDHSGYLPKDSLFSGPAGGVVGAAEAGRKGGIKNLLSFDMGGTSTDVARYDGKFEYQYETKIGNSTIVSPSLNIETIASGGGSICQFDGFKFSVGPESAGSSPGPACYGEGGPLTITDVNLLLGRLDDQNFGIPINRSKSEKVLMDLLGSGGRRNIPLEKFLSGFIQIVNEKMANAIRKISVNKGYDPGQYTLVSFGGAGGQHAVDLANILNINSILISYDASLLSAVGMGHAHIERFAVRQILQPLDKIRPSLPSLVQECSETAIRELKKENVPGDSIRINAVLFYLRFKGQETTLEVEYDGKDLRAKFKEAYQNLYGHWISNRIIEVESIKTIAVDQFPEERSQKKKITPYIPDSGKFKDAFIDEHWQNIPVYRWEELKPGATMEGPCLINSQYTTVVVNHGWKFSINAHDQAIGQKHIQDHSYYQNSHRGKEEINSINLELFTNRFSAIAEEMGALLKRTSFSINIKERLDYSCAVLDENGELIVNAPHIPVHLGGLGLCVRSMIERFEFQPGDVVITNHPGFGGSHLPDITLVAPVFDKNKELLGFVANRAHHAELGGKRPGSMPPDARNLAEEGKVIFPAYLRRGNSIYWTRIKDILSEPPNPSRSIKENLADLNGALASIQSGIQSLKKLSLLYGGEKVKHFMSELKKYACEMLMSSLATNFQTHLVAHEQLDDGSSLKARLSLKGRNIKIDFTGSSNVHSGNLNATPAIVRSAVIYVLRLMIREPVPLNEGIMKFVRILIPEGFLNPGFSDDPALCPAVVGGNTETSQRIVDTLIKALNLAACSQGTMNNFLFGDQNFSYYETICGGVGAMEGFHGASAVHQHMTNTRITDPEVLEFRYPVRLDHFYVRENSGGKGRWQGGNGVTRKMTFLAPLEITLLSQHRKVAPYGMNGGKSGVVGNQWILRQNGKKELLNGIDAAKVEPGDAVVIQTPGGGGWGALNDE